MNTDLDLSELNLKIGQLFMAGIPGTCLDKGTKALIRDYNLGGVILFSRNIEDPVQVAELCRDIQNAALNYHGIPVFLSVDQEGGRVARLKEPFTVFPGNSAIGADIDPVGKAMEFGRTTASEMKLVGLNMDLAPVVDVYRDKLDDHLKGRLFSKDPEEVSVLGKTVVKALQENGIMAVAKHFPGLGQATTDPHFNLPRIDADENEIESINLPPFKALIDEGVSGVMTSHAIYSSLDSQSPATLSSVILTDLLRKKIGFKGLIITDDLEMGAIKKKWGVAEGALASFIAGADLLLVCENQERLLESISLVRKKVLQNQISVKRLQQSINRIMKAKRRFLKSRKTAQLKKVKEYFKLIA